jgi:hypothetical protein
MKHNTTEQLLEVAEVKPAEILTRRERLNRWAELLKRDPAARLRTLEGTEWQLQVQKSLMRADGSPLTVAYKDPVLRAAGLQDDTFGEAMRFFDLSEHDAHRIVCYCMHGRTVESQAAAKAVRAIAAGRTVESNSVVVWTTVALPFVCFASYLLTKLA